ncbi:MAG: DUF11 domain-containing protein [Rubripirellula sp.]
MSKLTSTLPLIAGALALATGCAMPGANQALLSSSAPRQAPMMLGQTMGAAQQMGAARQMGAVQQPATQNSQVAQVGFFRSAGGSRGPNIPCGPALVGSPAPAGLVGGACGCNSCGSSDCAPQNPQGYVMQSQVGWNAYGIDPQEFLCDGGDHQPRAIVKQDDSVGGLQPEDTVVHYTTDAGDIEVQASNRTCVYAPRFVSVRKITGALAGGRAVGLKQVDRPLGTDLVDLNQPGLVMTETTELGHADVARRIDAMRERNRGVPIEMIVQPQQAGEILTALAAIDNLATGQLQDIEKALLEEMSLAAVTWSLDESLEVAIEDMKAPTLTRDQQVRGFTIYDFPDAGRLEIVKLADRNHALPGEIVNFAIRIVNVGDSPVQNVVLNDNLTTRLEYVEDSQTCTGGADFKAVANNAQSLRLEWTLTDKLRVGESVTIRFRCKVR